MRLSLWFVLPVIAVAADWPQWRGPQRNGTTVFQAPPAWPRQLHKVWSTPVGGGFSTPVALGNRVLAFTRESEQEVVQSVDRATGKVLWRQSYPAPFTKNKYATEMGSGPHSTPVLTPERAYTLGITGVLTCWNAATGAIVWRKDFSEQSKTTDMFTGVAMSPVLDSGLLIVHVGNDSKGFLTAFDAASGARRWTLEGDGPGYASPVIAEFNGVRQLITLTDRRAVAVSVKEGKLLWSLDFKDEWNENIATPVVAGNRILFSGVRKGTFAVDITPQGPVPAWQNKDLTLYMNSPILDGAHFYGMSNKRKGYLFAAELATGKVLWTTTGREGANMSLVSAGEFLFALNEAGSLKVMRRNPARYEEVAAYQVSESATWAQPLILDGDILIKESGSLVLYRIASK